MISNYSLLLACMDWSLHQIGAGFDFACLAFIPPRWKESMNMELVLKLYMISILEERAII